MTPLIFKDGKLTRAELEEITGVGSGHPVKQANFLKKAGIKCFINARKQVITFRSWILAAALPEPAIEPNNEPEDELELDFSKIGTKDGGKAKESVRQLASVSRIPRPN